MEQILTILFSVLGIYLLLGLLFALPFLFFAKTKGIERLDEGTIGTSKGFKLLILPGVLLFWLPLLLKWRKS